MKSKTLMKRILCGAIAVATAVSLTACVMPLDEAKDFTSTSVGFVVAPSPEVSTRKVTITGNPVNVRSGPGKKYSVIGKTSKGKSFGYLGSKKDKNKTVWYKIQYTSSKTGWVISSLSKLKEAKSIQFKLEGQLIEKRPEFGMDDRRLLHRINFEKGTIDLYGKEYKLLDTKKDSAGTKWYKIQFTSSKTGWVISTLAYIEGEKNTSTPKKNNGKVAYLTFDDGPSINTMKILDILDQYNVKATFFVIYHKGMTKQYKAIVDRGHTIALHSYTHDYSKIYKSEKGYYSDLNKIHDYVKKTTGVDSRIIRFPGGSSNTVSNKYNKGIMKTLKSSVTKNGYYYHDWNVSSGDAGGINRKASVLLGNVKKGVGKKKVINVLMHDTGKSKMTTVEALPSIIEYIRKQGYSFEALTEDSVLIQHGR